MTKNQPPATANLFGEHRPETPSETFHLAYIDGGSRGNPGPAAYAVIVQSPDGRAIFELGKYIGRETNNVAEYYGLIAALDYATANGIRRLHVRSDSELMVRQMQGSYRVKSTELRPLHERALKLARSLERFRIEHVRREQNAEADRLVNLALDRTGTRGPAIGPSASQPVSGGRDLGGARNDNQEKPEKETARRVRAHYVGGVLVPFEPLDLPEGAEVTFELRTLPVKS